jgi:uncharacterized protein (DUF488 family)
MTKKLDKEFNKEIWTIGHSTRSIDDFLELLIQNKIEVLADIRSYPGSKRYPHFNKEEMHKTLPQNNIEYINFKELGGRRKAKRDSHNTNWRNEAFRGYADYMETEEFKNAAKTLEEIAAKKRTAYMCSEAVWWRCHRALVSDYLKYHGWKVIHILDKNKLQEHPYTSQANTENGLGYGKDDGNFSLFE